MNGKITKIGITHEKISGRGGLSFILRYIQKVNLYALIINSLKNEVNQSGKGLQFIDFLKQMFAFIIDGTNISLSYFDHLKQDTGYSALLESSNENLASSHQIKRFFKKISLLKDMDFNNTLHELFIWRLKIDRPDRIVLGIDTMVLDNDDARNREGCETTYKNKKGFQPLHICWGSYLIDVLFRKGSAHSNHGTDYIDRVTAVVKLIRSRYSADIPIILCADSGFADQKAFSYFEEELKIHYITTSRIYKVPKEFIGDIDVKSLTQYDKGKAAWGYTEFGSKSGTWDRFRRAIFTKLIRDDKGQYIMSFDKPDSLIYTNIGNSPEADKRLCESGLKSYFKPDSIIGLSHHRGADELIHRSLKELATKEQLPFKAFGMNRAFYFLLVIVHFMIEAYKRDVTADVIPITAYPNTFRRKLIDFAVKITSKARNTILKTTKIIYNILNVEILWERCQSPPIIQLVY